MYRGKSGTEFSQFLGWLTELYTFTVIETNTGGPILKY